MSGSLAQLFVATTQSQTQLTLQFLKVAKFSPHIDQFFFQAPTHRCARLQARPSQIQEALNLAEFESQALRTADKSQCLNVVFAVLPEAARCPSWSRQQGAALIESNRVDAEANPLCDGANLHKPDS